ncbi:MAG: hypothetical protein HC842_06325 [Cytophagales bacterium]|nr:hypothetical protein [Cytophagales bacterium]
MGFAQVSAAQDTCAIQGLRYLHETTQLAMPNPGPISSSAPLELEDLQLLPGDNSPNLFASDYIEIGTATLDHDASFLSFDSVLNYFQASEFYDFGKIRIDWSPYRNFDLGQTPRMNLFRIDSETQDTIIFPHCVDFESLQFIDTEVVPGRAYTYCAQAYVLDEHGAIMEISRPLCDQGVTMEHGMEARNGAQGDSDGEIQIIWNVDANCLEGATGEDVYFEIHDATHGKDVFVAEISDPSEYLNFGTFKNGSQLNFNGTDARINLPVYEALENNLVWSAEFWIRVDSSHTYGGPHYLLASSDGLGLYYHYDVAQHSAMLYYQMPDTLVDLNISISADAWHHVAITSSFPATRFYIDGLNSQHLPFGQRWTFDHLGATPSHAGIKGQLGHTRFWSTTRSTEEISHNYLYGLRGQEHHLAAYYRLDDGYGQEQVLDRVSQSANASLSQTFWTNFIEDTKKNQAYRWIHTLYADQDLVHQYKLNIYQIGTGDQVCPELTATTRTRPLARETPVSIDQSDPDKITLAWESLVSDWANGYRVMRSPAGQNQFTQVAFIQDTAQRYFEDRFRFDDQASLRIGQLYDYKVVAVNNRFGSLALNPIPRGSTFPLTLDIVASNDTLFLSWPDLSVLGAMGYDTLKITRDGKVLRQFADLSRTQSFDAFPIRRHSA